MAPSPRLTFAARRIRHWYRVEARGLSRKESRVGSEERQAPALIFGNRESGTGAGFGPSSGSETRTGSHICTRRRKLVDLLAELCRGGGELF